jgi:BRI1 kinase inhibitor 1
MSYHLGRVVSDLSHSNSGGPRGRGLHHRQSTATSNTDGGGNVGKAKHKLALLFSGVAAWTRSESSAAAETGSSGRVKNSRKPQQTTSRDGTTTSARRRGLDIAVAVRKYVSMVEQLFASYSSGGSSSSGRDGDGRRPRAHTFTYGRGGSAASSKRHKGRLSSAPASLRGSPANSGHLSVGDSVTKASSTPSEVSTTEELHSAIQAAIAHCKNSAIATSQSAAGDKQQRKC